MDDETKQHTFFIAQNIKIPEDHQALRIAPVPFKFNYESLITKNAKLSFQVFIRFLSLLDNSHQFDHSNPQLRCIYSGKIYRDKDSSDDGPTYNYSINTLEQNCSINLVEKISTSKNWKFEKKIAIIDEVNQTEERYAIYLFTPCISYQEEQKRIFTQTMYKHYHHNHPFIKLAKIIKKKTDDIFFSNMLFKLAYSPSAIYKASRSLIADLSDEFWNKQKGFIELHLTDNPLYPMEIPSTDKLKYIHSLCFLVNEFQDIINRMDVLELDSSFYVLEPYVYCVPEAIVANESIPLGVTVGPSENYQIYSQFLLFVKSIDNNAYEILKQHPVLSDEGSAVKKFCKINNILQFFCYRHLINKFGANSPLAGLVTNLLFTQTKEEFIETFYNSKTLILQELNKTTQQHIKQFEDLFQCKTIVNNKEITDITEPLFEEQSMWKRALFHCPTCTNHSESSHSHLNQCAINCRLYNKRLNIIFDYIQNRLHKFKKRNNLKNEIRFLLMQAYNEKPREICKCQNPFKSALYHIDFPCIHNVSKFSFEDFPPLIQPVFDCKKVTMKEVSGDEKKWIFPSSKNLPYFTLTEDAILLLNVLGHPDNKDLKPLVKMLPHYDLSRHEQKNYISLLYVNFMASRLGTYDYSKPIIDEFRDFSFNFVYNGLKLDTYNKNNAYDSKIRNDNIKTLKETILSSSIASTEEFKREPIEGLFINTNISVKEPLDKISNEEELIMNDIDSTEESMTHKGNKLQNEIILADSFEDNIPDMIIPDPLPIDNQSKDLNLNDESDKLISEKEKRNLSNSKIRALINEFQKEVKEVSESDLSDDTRALELMKRFDEKFGLIKEKIKNEKEKEEN